MPCNITVNSFVVFTTAQTYQATQFSVELKPLCSSHRKKMDDELGNKKYKSR